MTDSTAAPPVERAGDDGPTGDVRSYEVLRLTIGFVAIAMPLVVLAIVAFVEGDLLGSISESYHHTFAASVFIGSMCAFAAFLWAYQVKKQEFLGLYENGWGNVGAFLALGVAVFSNAPETSTRPALSPTEGAAQPLLPPPPAGAAQPQSPGFDTVYEHLDVHVVAGVHLVSALLFFVVLLVFCLLWLRDDSSGSSRAMRTSYRASGVAIVTGMVIAVGTFAAGEGRIVSTLFLFAEIVMVEGFGYSWLVRGTVAPRVAGRMLAAVTIPIVVMLVGFTASTNSDPGVALEPWMSWLAAGLGVVGVVVALLFLIGHLRPRVDGTTGERRLRARTSE
jgi:hypothetical protein